MITREQTQAHIERIVHLAMTEYAGANGLVYNSFDSRTGAKDTTSLVRDLGDYAQYVAWAGKLLDRPEWIDWAVEQVDLARRFGANWRGLIDSHIDTSRTKPRKLHPWHPLFPAWHDDLLLGLVEILRITGNESVRNTILDMVNGLRDTALRPDGCLAAAVVPFARMKAKVADPRYCGLIAEEFVEVAELTGRDELLDDAERMIDYWIASPFFQKFGLIPDNDHITPTGVRYAVEPLCLIESVPGAGLPAVLMGCLPRPLRWMENEALLLPLKYLKRGRWKRLVAPTSTVMKSNTLLMFGLLELLRKRPSDRLRDAFMKWFDSVQEKLACPDGGYFTRYNAFTGTEGETVCLGQNFAITEVFIEGYVVLKEQRLLDAAVKSADFWLTQQFAETGLLREYPFTGWDGAVLDSNTDMAVNYLKLAEITGEETYRDAAFAIANGINTHLWTDQGLYTQCDGATGERTQSETDYVIKIKWNLLHLKLLLLICETLAGRKLLGNSTLWKLARDR
ncbi:MAG: hypothetical protein GXP25_12940 [Planctomycetes bacterium]|nr:hypothetical protein [Planctomycetota bacterium]